MGRKATEEKTRRFSLYLLKEGYNDTNSMDEPPLELPSDKNADMPGLKIFGIAKKGIPPWWKEFLGITEDLRITNHSAIAFLPVDVGTEKPRCFALCFGHSYHRLKKEAYEHDFGLIVTLNSVDGDKIRNVDTTEPTKATNKRIQNTSGNSLTYLDFNHDSSILKNLAGKVKYEYEGFFNSSAGYSSLTVTMKIVARDLIGRCKFFYDMYKKEDYKTIFPGLDNIKPVRDPITTAKLEKALWEDFKKSADNFYEKEETGNIDFLIPFIIDHQSDLEFSFSADGDRREYIFIGDYFSHLRAKHGDVKDWKIGLDELKKEKIFFFLDGNFKSKESVYDYLLFEKKLGAKSYYLSDGIWYEVEEKYVATLDSYLDQPKFGYDGYDFIDFNHQDAKSRYSETAYNKAVADKDPKIILLDQKNIAPVEPEIVEPCDLFLPADKKGKKKVLFHVKRHTASQGLSHLFNQGANATSLLILEDESSKKMDDLIKSSGTAIGKDFTIVFVIITRKEKDKGSKNLPLFSKMSLRRTLKDIQGRQIAVHYCFVKDDTPKRK